MKKVIIIGGGLAGLVTSVQIARAGLECLVFEKKHYPFHRVCGEYISNETTQFLKNIGLYPFSFQPPQISRFMLSAVSGKHQTLPLDLGGFGISRFTFDNFLYEKAKEAGVKFALNTQIENVEFLGHSFRVRAGDHEYDASVVLGAFGKRSNLDVRLDRKFIKKRSPYIGVKYHIRRDHDANLIALHNFPGGYCGVSKIEDDKVNLCYLVQREKLKQHKTIDAMEKHVLGCNPFLKEIFDNSEFLMEKPETINEISFETKAPVENHILMIGDAAGMITPLCGNGMAMAIHAGKMASEFTIRFLQDSHYTRDQLESDFRLSWNHAFRTRLWAGRKIQKLFGSESASSLAINIALYVKPVAEAIIRNTHGKPF